MAWTSCPWELDLNWFIISSDWSSFYSSGIRNIPHLDVYQHPTLLLTSSSYIHICSHFTSFHTNPDLDLPFSKLSSRNWEFFLCSHYFWHHHLSFLCYKLHITSPLAFYSLRKQPPFVLINIFYNLFLELLRIKLITFCTIWRWGKNGWSWGQGRNMVIALTRSWLLIWTICMCSQHVQICHVS